MYSSINEITNPTIDIQTQKPFDKSFSQNQLRDDLHPHMTLTMTKLGTRVPNQKFKPKCGSLSKNESLQCLKCECADP